MGWRRRALVGGLVLLFGCDTNEATSTAPAAEPTPPPVVTGPPAQEEFEALWGELFTVERVEPGEQGDWLPFARYRLRARAPGSAVFGVRYSGGAVESNWVVVQPPGPRDLPAEPEDARVSVGDEVVLRVQVRSPPLRWVRGDSEPEAAPPRVVLGPIPAEMTELTSYYEGLAPHFVNPQRASREGHADWTMVVLEAAAPGRRDAPTGLGNDVRVVERGRPVSVELSDGLSFENSLRPGDRWFVTARNPERRRDGNPREHDPLIGLEGL